VGRSVAEVFLVYVVVPNESPSHRGTIPGPPMIADRAALPGVRRILMTLRHSRPLLVPFTSCYVASRGLVSQSRPLPRPSRRQKSVCSSKMTCSILSLPRWARRKLAAAWSVFFLLRQKSDCRSRRPRSPQCRVFVGVGTPLHSDVCTATSRSTRSRTIIASRDSFAKNQKR
jgi:hypothetical protein